MVNLIDPWGVGTARALGAPAPSPTLLTAAQIESFHRDGYLTLPSLTTDAELQWLRKIYDRLFEKRRGWEQGDFFDLVGTDEPGQETRLPQLLMPSRYAPGLAESLVRRNASEVARQLLNPSAKMLFEHAILKPAFRGPATPWHQDLAFTENNRFESLSIWVPLQDVDETTGCMQFIPGSHLQGLHSHRSLDDDPRIHAVQAVEPDLSGLVTCPLPAGGATIHDYRLMHGSGPNVSANPRRAYAMVFGVRSDNAGPASHPWNAGKQTARERRYLASRTTAQRLRDVARAARGRLR